jgi:hypothetical protein
VAAAGGGPEWDVLYSHFKQAGTPQDEVRYLHALAGFAHAEQLERTIELVFSDEVRNQDAPYVLAGVLARREGSKLAWEAIEHHWEEMQAGWPPNTLHRMLESLPGLVAAGAPVIERACAWLDEHPLARGGRKLEQSRERLRVNQAFQARVGDHLRSALDAARQGPAATAAP